MVVNRASITALITAYCRAYHATHDNPKIFDDFLADQMFTPEEHVAFDKSLAETLALINPERAARQPDQATALAWVVQTHNGPITLSRSRYTEDRLVALIDRGVRQYVILGAGLDTFAFRRTDLLERVQVFEVDHPATLAMKHERLAILGRPYPPQLHFVAVDFAAESVAEPLLAGGYATQRLSCFSWLGVTYYLTRAAIFDTLRAVASIAPAGSSIIFDYLDADAFVPERAARRVQILQAIAARVGEPMQTGFDPHTLAADLQTVGFRLEEDLGSVEIDARYFRDRTDEYHAFEHVHFARAVVA